jgi:hypothetical protein
LPERSNWLDQKIALCEEQIKKKVKSGEKDVVAAIFKVVAAYLFRNARAHVGQGFPTLGIEFGHIFSFINSTMY